MGGLFQGSNMYKNRVTYRSPNDPDFLSLSKYTFSKKKAIIDSKLWHISRSSK